MRIESITATVARFFATAEVREICNAVSKSFAICLHQWHVRMLLGMPRYPSPMQSSLINSNHFALLSLRELSSDSGECDCIGFQREFKRGNPSNLLQLQLAYADYSAVDSAGRRRG